MLAGISVLCFTASYVVALLLEAARPWTRSRWPARVALAMGCAGLFAQLVFLLQRATEANASPLSSPFDWYLLASWTLAALYVFLALGRPTLAVGLFLLPAVLALIGAAQFASRQPFTLERASRFWGNAHGSFLLLGTVTVIIGFLAGLMYLVQSYRLKHKLLPTSGFRLPSLEWLQRVNNRALWFSVMLIGGGFASGVILNMIRHQHETDYVPWTDAVVLLTALMFGYLLVAAIFSLVYRPAREGRKVAYLTVASLLFLVLTLSALLLGDAHHGASQGPPTRISTTRAV